MSGSMGRSWCPPSLFFGRMKELVDYRQRPDEPGLYTWNCDHDLRRARWVATQMEMPWRQVKEWLADHGAKCDCTVMFNAVHYWATHRDGDKCVCGFEGWIVMWNKSQRILRAVTAGSMICVAIPAGHAWLAQFADRDDLSSLLGMMFFTAVWAWVCIGWWLGIIGIRIDKDESSG